MNREKLYQQAWFQPLLPALRLFKRELTSTYYLPQLWQEEQASRNWLQKQGAFSRSVEWAPAPGAQKQRLFQWLGAGPQCFAQFNRLSVSRPGGPAPSG
jgi:hypothetical protein